MNSSIPSIAPLPQPTVSTLRSSTIITSLPQALCELVQNALDAQARQIVVYLDLERWGLRVEDDGTGMRREAVEAIGSGGRYGTSKTSSHSSLALHSTFGFRGEALASLASIAYLEVSSSTKASPASWSSSIKGSKPISSGPSRTYKRIKPGTTVVVKDLFFNLPIRRLSHASPSSTIQTARKLLETASMLFPEVAFTLIDREKEKDSNGGRIWGVGKTSSILLRFSDIHGIALVQSVTELDVLESGKSEEKDGMKVVGFVSLQGGHSRAYQYLYVNRHPLAWCELHKAIETRFERSGFGRTSLADVSPGSPSRSRRSPRKLDRKPIYVLNLLVPPKKLDRNLEPAKAAVQFEDWSAVTSLLLSAVDQFLDKHGLSVASKDQARLREGGARGSPSPSPLKKRPRRVEEVREEEVDRAFVADPSLGEEGELKRWQDPSTKEVFLIDSRTGHSFPALTRRTGGDEDETEGLPGEGLKRMSLKRDGGGSRGGGEERGKEVPRWLESTLKNWTNPTFASRLEPSIPSLPLQQQQPFSNFDSFANQNSPNNAFSSSSSSSHNPFRQPISAFKSAITHFANNSLPSLDPTSTSQFTKSSLKAARVVAQIDRKFIACVLPDDPSSSSRSRKKATDGGGGTLVLIDQHAADERIRVERFLKQLGDGFLSFSNTHDDEERRIPLHPTPSLLLLLTPTEHSYLLANPSLLLAFKKWGIHLRLPTPTSTPKSSTAPVQIHIDCVPALLAERLEGKKTKGEVESGIGREAPRELGELVKAYLERLVSGGELEGVLNASRKTRARERGEGERAEWLGALRWCPREMLDLVNSKACRGAIMFNDPLTPQQYEKLIRELSETVFPFQCAHGRPSIVPLVNLDDFVKSQEARPSRRRTLDWEGLGLDA